MLQATEPEDDAPRATAFLEGGHGLPLSDGNASPMSPGKCCQIVASTFLVLFYYIGISGVRKAWELGFEPSSTHVRWHFGNVGLTLQNVGR
jgi:hypothetical protein